MNLQTIKSIAGRDEYVLLPVATYHQLKKQIDHLLDKKNYVPFELEDYVQNPITLARIKANLTQEILAKRLGVSQAYISKIESQKRVSAKLMMKIEQAISMAS